MCRADKTPIVLQPGESSSFEFIDPPLIYFSMESLALYEDIRANQAKALAQGASRDVKMYGADS